MGYRKPKARLHREFLYLDDGSIVNSLSAIEAGKIDEIIEQTRLTTGSGIEAGLGYGPAKIAAKKGKDSDVTANLRRTRTAFSAFDAWYRHLSEAEALGVLTSWDEDTRNQLEVGDTIELRARLEIAPIHKLIALFVKYVESANRPDSFLTVDKRQMPGLRKVAQQAKGMLRGADGGTSTLVYVQPFGEGSPPMLASLSDQNLVGDLGSVDGEYTVIAQVSMLLREADRIAALRVMNDAPRTDNEVATMTEALEGLVESASGMGIKIDAGDKSFGYPTVIVHPLAVFR